MTKDDDTRAGASASDQIDRDAIRLRRALLISSVVATFGCSGAQDDGGAHASSSTLASAVVSASVSASASTSSSSTVVSETPQLKAWTERVADAPPLTVAADLSAADRVQVQAVVNEVKPLYDKLEQVQKDVPKLCDLNVPGCKEQWAPLAKTLIEVESTLPEGRRFNFSCGWSEDYRNATVLLRQNHLSFLAKLYHALRDDLDAAVDKSGLPSAQVWLKMRTRAKDTSPMPCLSPCAMPPTPRLPDGIEFADGESTPSAVGLAKLNALIELMKTSTTRDGKPFNVEVRGSADASEKDAVALSKRRAEAVRDLIIKAGVDKKRITVLGVGASFPVAASTTEENKKQNRVVWLETRGTP